MKKSQINSNFLDFSCFVYFCFTLQFLNFTIKSTILNLSVLLRIDRPDTIESLNRTSCGIQPYIFELIRVDLLALVLFHPVNMACPPHIEKYACHIIRYCRLSCSQMITILSNMVTLLKVCNLHVFQND